MVNKKNYMERRNSPFTFLRSISNLMYLFHIPKGVQPTRGRESLWAADGTMKNMLCDLHLHRASVNCFVLTTQLLLEL